MKRRAVLSLMLAGAAACGLEQQSPEAESGDRIPQQITLDGAQSGKGSSRGILLGASAEAFITYTGTDGRLNIHRSVPAGVNPIQTLNEYPLSGSEFIRFQGVNYLMWFGTDHQLNVMTSYDGVNWGNKITRNVSGPGYRPNGDPKPVIYGGTLNIFYAVVPSVANPDRVQWETLGRIHQQVLRPEGWTFNGALDAQTRSTPSAAVLGNQLVIAWTARDSSHFRTIKFTPGVGWGATNFILRAQEGDLFTLEDGSLAWLYRWTGGANRDALEIARSWDGVNFHFATVADAWSGEQPEILGNTNAHGNALWFTFVGTDAARSVNFRGQYIP